MSRRRSPRDDEDATDTADDLQVWAQVARSIEPARKLKPRAMRTAATPPAGLRRDPGATPSTSKPKPSPAPVSRPYVPQQIPSARPASTPPPTEFDRRQIRRIGKGREPIDARLDLHHMTQDQAHGALRRFLHDAHANDYRLVLVITGKGGGLASNAWGQERSERGVLRRNVPRWLAEPDLRPLVVGVAPATHHGGDGALYVRLRAKR